MYPVRLSSVTIDSNTAFETKYEIFKKWKFGTINIRSGKEKDEGAKIYSITKEISKLDLSFCCLQEVKYRNTGNKLIRLDNGEQYRFIWCGPKKRRKSGVGIIIRVDKEIEFNDPDVEEQRLMAMNVKVGGFNIRLVNAYSPTETGCESAKNNFYRSLRKAAVKHEKHQKMIILGDFNAKTSTAYWKSEFDGVQLVHDDDCNDNGYRMKNFCRSHTLGIASTFFDHEMENRWTWYSPDQKTKRINDYVLTEKFVQRYMTDCIALPEADFNSDHRILVTEMNTPKTKKARWTEREKSKAKTKPNSKLLKDEYFRKQFTDSVAVELSRTPNGTMSTDEKAKSILNVIDVAAVKTIPIEGKVNHEKEIWRNDTEFNDIINSRQNTNKESDAYKELTKKLKKRIKFLRNCRLKEEAREINRFATNREIENLYKKFKKDSSTFRNFKTSNKCEPLLLKEHFSNHFNSEEMKERPVELERAPDFIEMLRNCREKINVEPPTRAELIDVIKKLKNGKAATDVPAEFIKAAISIDAFTDAMLSLYVEIWSTLEIPKSWSHTKLVAIWKGSKKGSIQDPTAYRGLQIGSSLCKILILIIINRIKKWYEEQLCDQQQGFRAGRGTADGIYIAKRIQQISHSTKKPLYVLFIDLTAAFDKIKREWLFQSIRQRISGSQKIVDILEKLYAHTTTALAETPDDIFELILGVRQGGPESPILYNLFMDFVMRVFMKKCTLKNIGFPRLLYKIPAHASAGKRVKVGFNQIDWSGYADDLVLAFDSKRNLKKALDELNETFERFSLKINASKTKTMVFNPMDSEDYPESIVQLGDTRIENVKIFRYLGSDIKYDQPNTGDAEIELRIDCAESKFYQHSKKFINHSISLKTRTQIFDALVRSRLTYGCQAWALTSVQLQRIISCYMGMLRKMVRQGYRRVEGTYRLAISNSRLLQICGATCVGEYIAKQQKKYLAHITRMDDSTTAKKLLFNGNKSRRPGREITLLSTVTKNERCSEEEFFRNALSRKF